MAIIVKHNQSVFDIAIQENGSVFNALAWAVANRKSVSDSLEPGENLQEPGTVEFSVTPVAAFLKTKGYAIGTAYTEPDPGLINYEFPQGELPLSL